MTMPPPTFRTQSDVDAFIKRRVKRALVWWAPSAVVLIVVTTWAQEHGLGSLLHGISKALEQTFGVALGSVLGIAMVLFVYCVLPVVPWGIAAHCCERTLKRRVRKIDCVSCGYSLASLAECNESDAVVCPECGATYAMTPSTT